MKESTVLTAALGVALVFFALECFALYAGSQCKGAEYVTMHAFTYTCHYR